MREIKDNLYIFSVAPADYGAIIASRNDSGEICEGADIFSHLHISTEEKHFFLGSLACYGNEDVALIGERGGEARVVIISRFFSYASSLCLAVEFDLPAEDVSMVLCRDAIGDVFLSDRVKSLGNTEDIKTRDLSMTYQYIFAVSRRVSALREIKLSRRHLSPREICDAAMNCSELVGVGFEYQIRNVFDGPLFDAGSIFSGRLLVAVMLTLCMAARDHSTDRVLFITVEERSSYVSISAILEIKSGIIPDTISRLEQYVKSYGAIFDAYEREGMLICDFIPHYADAGVVGMKQGEIFFDDVLWRETF